MQRGDSLWAGQNKPFAAWGWDKAPEPWGLQVREQESSLSSCARLYFVLLIFYFSAAYLLSVSSATCQQDDLKELSERTENECERFNSFKEVKSVPLSLESWL